MNNLNKIFKKAFTNNPNLHIHYGLKTKNPILTTNYITKNFGRKYTRYATPSGYNLKLFSSVTEKSKLTEDNTHEPNNELLGVNSQKDLNRAEWSKNQYVSENLNENGKFSQKSGDDKQDDKSSTEVDSQIQDTAERKKLKPKKKPAPTGKNVYKHEVEYIDNEVLTELEEKYINEKLIFGDENINSYRSKEHKIEQVDTNEPYYIV